MAITKALAGTARHDGNLDRIGAIWAWQARRDRARQGAIQARRGYGRAGQDGEARLERGWNEAGQGRLVMRRNRP